MLQRFHQRAPEYDRENRFFDEDFEELRRSGYLNLFVPREFGGVGAGLIDVTRLQRRLAYYAPATAIAVNMHLYWTGIAADLRRFGDHTLDWVLEESINGEVFAAGRHGRAVSQSGRVRSSPDATSPLEPAMRISVRPFETADLDSAGGLLAARHRADRGATPELPQAFEDPVNARAQVANALVRTGTRGVVALEGGLLVGFLLGSIVLPPPDAFWAGILAPRSVEIPYAGYAASGAEPDEVYRAMYAALASEWPGSGCFTHFVEIHAADRVALDACFSLGFGQYLTLAARDTGPVLGDREPVQAIDIRQGGAEDIDAIMELSEGLWQHHARSPTFVPLLPEAMTPLRAYQLALLEDKANAYWLGCRDGRAVAMQTFHRQTHSEMARQVDSRSLASCVACRTLAWWTLAPLFHRSVPHSTYSRSSIKGRPSFCSAIGWSLLGRNR